MDLKIIYHERVGRREQGPNSVAKFVLTVLGFRAVFLQIS
jgi:hypothetical protein